jgi:hypothetical protein
MLSQRQILQLLQQHCRIRELLWLALFVEVLCKSCLSLGIICRTFDYDSLVSHIEKKSVLTLLTHARRWDHDPARCCNISLFMNAVWRNFRRVFSDSATASIHRA